MKFHVQKSSFAKALATVGRSISARATLPALSGVMLELNETGLVLYGSNLETAVRVHVAVDAEEEGIFLTPAKLFSDFVMSLPEGKVTVTSSDNVLTILSGKIKSTFAGLAVEDYPELGFDGHQTPYTLPGGVFATAIEHVSYAASTDDARAILTGLHVEVAQGLFELAATDGFRLAVEKMPVETGESFNLVIPAKVMSELGRLIRETESVERTANNTIRCGRTVEGTQMLFVLPNGVELITRLLEGTFPPYRKIIPTSYTTAVTFDVDALSAEIKRAALFGAGGSHMLKLEIQNSKIKDQDRNGLVTFSSGGAQVGEYSGEVEVQLEGSENKVAFNAKYLVDFLSRVKSKHVRLELNAPDTAGLWRVVGMEEYMYVVMPMNL